MSRKEDQPNKEVLWTSPEPFNHGTTSIQHLEVPRSVFEELSPVLEHGWHIDNVSSIGQAYAQAEISSNNFKVVGRDATYLLKLSHINTPEEQQIINEAMKYCENSGIPVPHIIPTNGGNLFFMKDGRIYCLYTFIDGEHFDGSQAELLNVAQELTGFNTALAELPNQNQVKRTKTLIHHDWEALDQAIKIFRSSRNVSKFDLEVKGIVDEVERESLALRSFDFESLPLQVVHTDLHPHNLLFDKQSGELLAFIDFDSLEYTQRVRGIGFAVHRLSRTYGEHTERKKDSGRDVRDRTKDFIQRYAEVGKLTQNEVEALPLIIQDEALRRITLILTGHYIKGDRRADYDFSKQLTTLREAKDLFAHVDH